MNIESLVQNRKEVNNNILQNLINDIEDIKFSADYMCECATNIKGQGYAVFISSREDFVSKLNTFEENIKGLYK